MPADSGLPADGIVNTFHFETISDPVASLTLAEIADALGDCYNSFSARLSPYYNQAATDVTYYNLADPEPRVPLETVSLGITSVPAGAAVGLPPEVALVVSFEGNQISGEPQARKRGRVYLGPWALDGAVSHIVPTDNILTAVDTGFESLLAASDAATDWKWCVFSNSLFKGTTKPPQSPLPLASCFFDVVRGWTDNAWDTQRRRGIQPTVRRLFPGLS